MGRPWLTSTVGAQLSEILNEELESKESGYSRRRVVKGVAWTLPVIMATVAVPPASASTGRYEALLDYANLQAATFVQLEKPSNSGQYRPGLAPTGFHLKNSSGLSSGPITGTITISSTNTADPRVGISALPGAVLTNTSLPTAASFSTKFRVEAGISNGATISFPLSFYYTGGSKSTGSGKQFNLTVSFDSPAGLLSLATILTLN